MIREEKTQPIPVVEQRSPGFDGSRDNNSRQNNRSLLERVGPPSRFQNQHPNMNNNFRGGPPQHQQPMYDPVQAQIDAVTAAQMGMPPFPMPMMSMDQIQMQEMIQSQAMMMNQMNQMMQQIGAQMVGANSNPIVNNTNNHPGGYNNGGSFGRGRGRGGSIHSGGRGGVSGGHTNGARPEPPASNASSITAPAPSTSVSVPIIAPQPRTTAAAAASTLTSISTAPTASATAASSPTPAYTALERPGTPTLCKFSVNCTNPVCRYSHPSPAATAESALVLSTEACEKGNKCEDKDCTKSHVSPATLNPNGMSPLFSITASYFLLLI